MKRIKLISALTGILLVVIVILQNTQPVETRILFLTMTMPNAVLIGLTLLIGIAAGTLITLTLSSKH